MERKRSDRETKRRRDIATEGQQRDRGKAEGQRNKDIKETER
jgi:hypothetical protein